MKRIRAIVVDDEQLARARICRLLAEEQELEVVAVCNNGQQAIAAIEETAPDLLFLDVQMPRMDGFEVLAAISRQRMPLVIFVTAFDQYAIRAFDVHAQDYLLKPFEERRFKDAVARAKKQLALTGRDGKDERLFDLLSSVQSSRKCLDAIMVRLPDRILFVKTEEIDWIEANDNYLRLHCGSACHTLRETMSALETKLDASKFVRIHRSTIVNLERVKEFRPWFNGDYLAILSDGAELKISRKYRQRVHDLLGQSL